MRRFLLGILLGLVLAWGVAASAQELATLTAPITYPNTTNYHVQRVITDFDAGTLTIQLLDNNNAALNCTYATPALVGVPVTGQQLDDGLNKADLSKAYAGNATTGSLKQRIFHRLVVMGEATAVCGKSLTGTLGGTVP